MVSLEGQLSLWKNPRSQGPSLPTPTPQQPELVSTSPQKLPVQPSREETEIAHAIAPTLRGEDSPDHRLLAGARLTAGWWALTDQGSRRQDGQ